MQMKQVDLATNGRLCIMLLNFKGKLCTFYHVWIDLAHNLHKNQIRYMFLLIFSVTCFFCFRNTLDTRTHSPPLLIPNLFPFGPIYLSESVAYIVLAYYSVIDWYFTNNLFCFRISKCQSVTCHHTDDRILTSSRLLLLCRITVRYMLRAQHLKITPKWKC